MRCEHCDNERPASPASRRYCSPQCQKAAQVARYRQRRRAWGARRVDEDKLSRGCLICRLPGPAYVLDHHHIDPGSKRFGLSYAHNYDRAAVEAELAKCVVLCANHHRMVEAGDLDLPSIREEVR